MTRNLIQFPITKDEVIMVLNECFSHEAKKEIIGDLRPYILHQLKLVIDRDFKKEDFNP